MKILWIIFWGVATKLAYIKVSFLCILGYFFKGKVQNRGYFLRLLKFQDFLGVLEIPDIFFLGGGGMNGRRWARAYVWRNN